MTLHTTSDSLFCRHDTVRHQEAVIQSGMALDTTDLAEMQCLIRQPFMFPHYVDFFPVSEELEMREISVAIQANLIIIGNGLFDVPGIPDINTV